MTPEEIAAAAANAALLASLKACAKKEVVGILLSSETITSKSGDIVVISIQDADDEISTMSCSPNYWKKIGKLFPVDSTVKASYEVRIKDKTFYEANGTRVAHTSDGNSLVGINRFSSAAFERMMLKNTVSEAVAQLQAVELERVDAISNFLGKVYGK